MKPKVIRLSDETYNRLAELAHPGQSMDGVLQEVFKDWDICKYKLKDIIPKPTEIPKPQEPPKTVEAKPTILESPSLPELQKRDKESTTALTIKPEN
ncbi:hypothetical protein M0R04_08665 [Candidatus Dojkabacteria bacterium]|jgi:hypothetical protein|nr:hypothetical protein [Candidatus Dojkabacteria bacterium]